MGSITRITWMSGRPLKHERSYFVDRPPSQKRKRVRLPRRVHHVSVIDPAGQDTEAREVLKRSLLVEVPHDLMRAHIPDRRVDALCEAPGSAVHVRVGLGPVVLHPAQTWGSGLRVVQREHLLEQICLADVTSAHLGLCLGVNPDRCLSHGLSVVTGPPKRRGVLPRPGVKLSGVCLLY